MKQSKIDAYIVLGMSLVVVLLFILIDSWRSLGIRTIDGIILLFLFMMFMYVRAIYDKIFYNEG